MSKRPLAASRRSFWVFVCGEKEKLLLQKNSEEVCLRLECVLEELFCEFWEFLREKCKFKTFLLGKKGVQVPLHVFNRSAQQKNLGFSGHATAKFQLVQLDPSCGNRYASRGAVSFADLQNQWYNGLQQDHDGKKWERLLSKVKDNFILIDSGVERLGPNSASRNRSRSKSRSRSRRSASVSKTIVSGRSEVEDVGSVVFVDRREDSLNHVRCSQPHCF